MSAYWAAREAIADFIGNKYVGIALFSALMIGWLFGACGFSLRQSLGLGLFFLMLNWSTWMGSPADRYQFTPYELRCYPSACRMFLDIGLVQSSEEFMRLFGPFNDSAVPWKENNVLCHGLYAVFLAGRGAVWSGRAVIHFPWEARYASTPNRFYRLVPMGTDMFGIDWARWEELKRIHGFDFKVADFDWVTWCRSSGLCCVGSWSPEIFMRLGVGGFEFGVRVKKEWWKRHKDSNAVVLRENSYYDMVDLVLCFLPFCTLSEFYWRPEKTPSAEQARSLVEAIKKAVSEKGWNNNLGPWDTEKPRGSYEHKYMSVSVSCLYDG